MKFLLLWSPSKDNRFLLASECFQKKYNALFTQSGISANKNDTAVSMNKVLIWWNILNLKTFQIDKLRNDPPEVKIRSPNDSRLDFIIEFGQMVLDMPDSQNNRIKQLSKHIASTIHHMYIAIVSLSTLFIYKL